MAVVDEFLELEPIFHTSAFGSTIDDFERRMTDDYWEVGASGTVYRRDEILHRLALEPPVDAVDAGWIVEEPRVIDLGSGSFLFTYLLLQGARQTRRATMWIRTAEGWRIRYHQGTLTLR